MKQTLTHLSSSKTGIMASILWASIAWWAEKAEAWKIPSCPAVTTKYSNDIAKVLSPSTEVQLETLLKKIDTETHHQLVFYSVENPEAYGFATTEELANAIGRQCKIWHVGVNSGIVLLTSKEPRRYRIETASIQTHLTDGLAKLILEASKKVCPPEDFSCRVPFIAGEIEKIIKEKLEIEYGGVEKFKEISQKFTAQENAKTLENILNSLWIGIIILLWIWGVMIIVRKDRKEDEEADRKLEEQLRKIKEGQEIEKIQKEARERASIYAKPPTPAEKPRTSQVFVTGTDTSEERRRNEERQRREDERRKREKDEEDRRRRERDAEDRRRRERDEDDRRRQRDEDDRRRRNSDDGGGSGWGGGSSGWSSGGYDSGGGGGFDGGGAGGD